MAPGVQTTVIIPAAGSGDRWGDFTGVPKQLVVVGGTPVIVRTVEGATRHGAHRVYVTVPQPGWLPGVEEFEWPVEVEPARFEADRFLNCHELWSTDGRTVILYGDVYFSESALTQILASDLGTFTVFGRRSRSWITGCRHGEIFALGWPSTENDLVLTQLRRLVGLQAAQVIHRSLGWELYRAMSGADDAHIEDPRFGHPDRFVLVDDWTDDFDTPEELLEWNARRALSLLRDYRPGILVTLPIDPQGRIANWVLPRILKKRIVRRLRVRGLAAPRTDRAWLDHTSR